MLSWFFTMLVTVSCFFALSQAQIAVPLSVTAPKSAQTVPSVRLSADGKYLVGPVGEPVFLAGDSPWSLIAELRHSK